jgi:hypothetical protein
MRRLTVLASALIALAAVVSPAAAQSDDATTIVVTALHAIPGENDFPADVYLNGELAIAGFTKMMRSDPFVLDPGPVDVAIYASGADPATATAAVAQTIEFTEAGNYVLVAHLTDDGQPILAVYVNNLSPIPMGQGRFVFRQTADVDPVDVVANGEVLATALANTGEVTVDLPAGTHQLEIVPTTGGDPLATTDVVLIEGELTAVFAITTLEGNTIDLAVQTVEGLQSTPSVVPTGTGGLAAPRGPGLSWALALIGLLALAGAAASVRRDAS